MANHRALGRAHVRNLHTGHASHRDSAVRAGVAKVGVLGALATATIAFPLASASAGGQTSPLPSIAGGQSASQAESARAAVAEQSAPVAIQEVGDSAAGTDSASDADAAMSVKKSPNAEAIEKLGGESQEGFIHPVDARITSGFGKRVHPVLHTVKEHDGVDFAAACGSDVRAAGAGTVVAVEQNSASGNRVKIDHGDGVITGYYHLSSFDTKVGDKVDQGDVIGKAGSTGRSTGCHLHFAKMDESGTYSNPMSLLK
ncbi:M23 family peptidase [Brachybacterium endophyticum]|uniref:M23 family peptidase n=1 Tax=Brachybacterium endophyticum TaxID=2182385 RepID=A0A2U2RHP8_9MICO|nr:M23 family metallopeptidase [Brachybacterium endophyticum]PWH05376.1 M23 family peptidase [Brachybacterium endophyticum]